MTRNTRIFGLMVLLAAPPAVAAGESAADRITLQDGTVVLGLVTGTTTGPRSAVEFVVRREWAERNAGAHLVSWDRTVASVSRRAIEQRRERLAGWRRERERSPDLGPDDRILRWIDAEQKRLADPEAAARTPLVPVRLPRGQVQKLDQQRIAASRMLRLAWTGGIREPESLDLAGLTDAIESRGFVVDPKGPAQSVPLDRLLPPMPESEVDWLARRASTEVAIDAGLRFLRYQDTVLPDPGPGQQGPGLNPAMALTEFRRLLDPDGGQGRPDPLMEKLQAVAARGRIGAIVTRLVIAPDLGGATVETAFWVRASGNRWFTYAARSSTVRADELQPGEGGDLAQDPQVKAAFGVVEALGLGAIPPEMKERSLRIGAATQKALGQARSEINRDLQATMLPVLEPATAAGAASPAPAKPAAPEAKPAARRSMLGPKNH